MTFCFPLHKLMKRKNARRGRGGGVGTGWMELDRLEESVRKGGKEREIKWRERERGL